ncbi:energy transducer TonB [Polaribacter haliotis]|uniref:Energy transducer TonB n=1 Tax=Polaribacter haliotis TaxID=1888915 RepID=A0A7L8AFT2_9FLAO|nr:energy transducer TonB [Polaribacter haliotis]QOD60804.1 energy transducer TonB [Polaribacter haliotis]
MKIKLTLIVLLLLSIEGFSQKNNFDYLKNSNPNPKNELSLHFKNAIPFRLLKNIKYPKATYTLNVFFYVNTLGEPYDISTSFKVNKELSNTIKKALLDFPIEKLNLGALDTKKRYSFQIIASTVQYENIIYCSSIIIEETLPVCEPCTDLEYYKDIKSCINLEIKNFFNRNLDSSAVNIAKKKTKSLKAKLRVNKKGKLILLKGENLDLFSGVTSNFPLFNSPAKINGKPTVYNYTFYPSTNNKNIFLNADEISNNKASSTNEFTKFITERLEAKYIGNSGLNRINKNLYLNFEIDKNGKPINIKTNARSYSLENKIIKLFKEYLNTQLNLEKRNTLANYFTTILTYKNGKTIVETLKKFGEETIPIFPGCEKSESISNAKKCFSKGVQRHFARTFDSKLPKKLGLSTGRKRILINFKVNKEGKSEDIRVKAPHPEIVDEVINVIRRLPKIKPGYQKGKPVSVKYAIPFTIIVN